MIVKLVNGIFVPSDFSFKSRHGNKLKSSVAVNGSQYIYIASTIRQDPYCKLKYPSVRKEGPIVTTMNKLFALAVLVAVVLACGASPSMSNRYYGYDGLDDRYSGSSSIKLSI